MVLLLALLLAMPFLAQDKPQPRPSTTVPFVGCPSDGQTGPLDPPQESGVPIVISAGAAKSLAYYKAAVGVGVLAPRGWHCFGLYGSGGDIFYVSPTTLNVAPPYTHETRFEDAAIEIQLHWGDTSGRYGVAEIIARVFPAYESFVAGVRRFFDFPPTEFPTGPYPTDKLVYKTKSLLEYRTPPRSDGLGTHSLLVKNDSPIAGAAILLGPAPDLAYIAVRLPPNLRTLTPVVIAQFERDAAGRYRK